MSFKGDQPLVCLACLLSVPLTGLFGALGGGRVSFVVQGGSCDGGMVPRRAMAAV